MNSPAPSRSFPGIDLIRLGAALLVTLYHLAYLSRLADPLRDDLGAIRPLAASGWVGVQIFFVISGFVIAFSASKGSGAGAFVRGRAARLYPAAWICASVTMSLGVRAASGGDYLRSMLLWPVGPWVSGVYWTLAVETSFYSLVAITLARRGPSALPRLAVGLGSVSALYWIVRIVAELRTGSSDWLFGPFNYFAGHLLLLRSGCLFAIGMLLFDAAARNDLGRWRWIAMFALCGFLSILHHAHTVAIEEGTVPTSFLFAPLLWLTTVLMLLAAVVWNTPLAAVLSRRARLVRALGLLTYPLYLIHSELGEWVIDHSRALGAWVSLALAIAVVLAAAALVLPLEGAIRRALFERRPRRAITVRRLA